MGGHGSLLVRMGLSQWACTNGAYRSDERRNVGGRTERSAVDDMTVLPARSRRTGGRRPALLGCACHCSGSYFLPAAHQS